MQSRKGFADILVVAAVVVFLGIGGYLYWQGQNTEDVDNGGDEPTLTIEATPTLQPMEPVDIGTLELPEDIDEWQESAYNQIEPWMFNYPLGWTEYQVMDFDEYGYTPDTYSSYGISVNAVSGNNNEIMQDIASLYDSSNYNVLSYEVAQLPNHEGEASFVVYEAFNVDGEKLEVGTSVYINNVEIKKSTDTNTQCVPGYVKIISKGSGKDVTVDIYYDKLKQIAATFQPKKCPLSN